MKEQTSQKRLVLVREYEFDSERRVLEVNMKHHYISNMIAGVLLTASGIAAVLGHVELAASLNGFGTLIILQSKDQQER